MSVQWIQHNGETILYFDHRGSSPGQIVHDLKAGTQMVEGISGGLRVLSNFEGAVVDISVMQMLKMSGAEVIEPVLDKAAVVGIRGIRHIMLQAYNRFTGAGENQCIFETEKEALEWLTS